jgi:hypothetical protein
MVNVLLRERREDTKRRLCKSEVEIEVTQPQTKGHTRN